MDYAARIAATQCALGIDANEVAARGLTICEEPAELVTVQTDADGREHRVTPATAAAWLAMRDAAAAEGVILQLVSAFRSFDYQAELIRRRLAQGLSIEEICRFSACPGYSEHHTGRAVDIDTPDNPGLGESFERTAAFAWLQRQAPARGFTMSYPRGNAQGYVYEPWHWFFQG